MARGGGRSSRSRPVPSLDILATIPFTVEDIIGPDVYLTSAPDAKEIQLSPYRFQVTYEDFSNVSAASVNRTGPVIVKGPENFEQIAQFVSTSAPIDAARISVEYQVFSEVTEALNGVYTIEVDESLVEDANGANPELSGPIGSFAVAIAVADDVSPTAEIVSLPERITIENSNPQAVTIKYRDNVEIDANTIVPGNIRVVTPRGADLEISVEATTTRSLVEIDVVYRVEAPPGGWAFDNNGTYSIGLGTSPVLDTSSNPVNSLIATFETAVPDLVFSFSTSSRVININYIVITQERLGLGNEGFSIDWGDESPVEAIAPGLHDYDATSSPLPVHTIKVFGLNPELVFRIILRRRSVQGVFAWSKRMTNLNRIDLRQNNISSLPDFHKEWISIDNISVDSNQITEFPQTHKEWTLLRNLFLSDNPIKKSPAIYREWTLFRRLGIAQTEIEEPPVLHIENTALDRLFFQSSSLKSWPTFHPTFVNLELISAGDCNIDTPPVLPRELTTLSRLYANDNQMAGVLTLHPEMVNLVSVVVENNLLTGFDTYPAWTKLEELNVNSNPLNQQLQTFAEWTNLQNLSVRNTGSPVRTELHEQWINIRSLELGGGSWVGSLNIPDTYVNLEELIVFHDALTEIPLHPNWRNMIFLRISAGHLRSPHIIPSTWTSLEMVNFAGLAAYPLADPPVIPRECIALQLLWFHSSDLTTSPVIPSELVNLNNIGLSGTFIPDFNPLLQNLITNGNPDSVDPRFLDISQSRVVGATVPLDASLVSAAEAAGWTIKT